MSQGLNITNLFDGLRAAFRGLRLSLVETVFLAAAVLFAAFVVTFYLTKIAPRQLEVSSLKKRGADAQIKLSQEARREEELKTQRENAQKILDSLHDFEARLKDKNNGKSEVMDEFPQLAKANHVSDGGVTFRTIEPDPTTDNNGNPVQPAAHNDKQLSVYPALGLDTTVEGDYHDLRRFISDLERSKQFIIINSITLQSIDEKARRSLKGAPLGPAPGQAPRPAAARTVPEEPTTITVSLKIETDTYFQKRITP